MGFPRRLLADDERLVLLRRRHVIVLFWPVILLIVLVAVTVGGSLAVPSGAAQPWLRLALGLVAALIAVRWVLWPFLVWRTTVYAITTRRLVIREGVFGRSGHDMPLTRLNDVSFSHNVWERMIGCGTLVVESAGERGQLELDDIPKVELVQRTLYRLADELRGIEHGDRIDPKLAQALDAEFDDEYRGPMPER